MVAGPPGAGKSTVALIAALRWAKAGIPGLYISADSDEDTMAARAAAALTGHPVRDIEQTISFGLFRDEYGPVLNDLPVRFEYDPSDPSIEDIVNTLTAFVEVWGEYPGFVVVDNLMNMSGDSDVEVQTQKKAMRELHWLARKTRSCVIVLHHTSEQNQDHLLSAPPRSAIQNKVSQLPALILTAAHNGGELFVAVVKHRHGEDDPKASNPLRWIVNFATFQVQDLTMNGHVFYGSSSE
jgi:KaiC/GvpD/RAD55 family RecA-like ATPase